MEQGRKGGREEGRKKGRDWRGKDEEGERQTGRSQEKEHRKTGIAEKLTNG